MDRSWNSNDAGSLVLDARSAALPVLCSRVRSIRGLFSARSGYRWTVTPRGRVRVPSSAWKLALSRLGSNRFAEEVLSRGLLHEDFFTRTGFSASDAADGEDDGTGAVTYLGGGGAPDQGGRGSVLGTRARFFFLRCRPCLLRQVPQGGGKASAVLLTTRTWSGRMGLG